MDLKDVHKLRHAGCLLQYQRRVLIVYKLLATREYTFFFSYQNS